MVSLAGVERAQEAVAVMAVPAEDSVAANEDMAEGSEVAMGFVVAKQVEDAAVEGWGGGGWCRSHTARDRSLRWLSSRL